MKERRGYVDFWETLPENEKIIVDILKQIVTAKLPDTCKEKFAWGVPCYYGKRQICIIWPAAIPRGGFKEGVLLGFSQGRLLNNARSYLKNGTNKKIYYRIIKSVEDIDEEAIVELLDEALVIDGMFK